MCDTLYAHPECKAGINFRINVEITQHIGVHHATAQYLYPAGMLAKVTTTAATYRTGYIHLGTWFCEWKIGRAKTDLRIGTKHFRNKIIKSLFQVCERYIFIYVQSFALVKETMRPG